MAKRRPSGDGMVRKREDGRWEGRIVIGHKENGAPIFHYLSARTQKELLEKPVSKALEEIMENRRAVRTESGSRAPRPVESAEDHAIAVAALRRAAGIVLTNGVRPDNECLRLAETEGVALLATLLSPFEASGRIYELLR